MKMIIRESNAIVLLILLCILAECQFLGLLKLDGIYKKMIMMAAVILSLALCFKKRSARHIILGKYKEISQYVLSVLFFVFGVQLIYSLIIKNTSLYDYLADAGRFAFLLAALPLVYIFDNEKREELFWGGFKAIAFLQFILGDIQNIFIHRYGINLLNSGTDWRGGELGILIVVPLVYLPMISTLSDLANGKSHNKIFDIIFLVLGMYFGVFISKNRSGYLAFFAGAALMLYASKAGKTNKHFKRFCIVILGVLVLLYLYISGFFSILFSISDGEYVSSNNAHIKAITECWRYFCENPILGAGFMLEWPVSYADSGFVGMLANMGIFSFYIFGIPVLRSCLHLIRGIGYSDGTGRREKMIGFTVFLLFTSFTFMQTDESRMMGFVVMYTYNTYSIISKKLGRRINIPVNCSVPLSNNDGGVYYKT